MEKQMSMEEKIRRINELYHKSKQEGLTDQEKEEQARLRQDLKFIVPRQHREG